MKKILIIGSGGREHALAWRLRQEGYQLYVAPGNAGMIWDGIFNAKIDVQSFDEVAKFTKKEGIELVIVGPEKPLCDGLADFLRAENIPVVGPNKSAAKLEGSKSFAKKLMVSCGIPTAGFRIFSDFNEASAYVKNVDHDIVIKADGLAGGKGVVVPKNVDHALAILTELMIEGKFGDASRTVVIEEKLIGVELSYMCLTDGKSIISLPTSRDYKPLRNGDEGPNTGGMGAITPSPDEHPETREWICEHILLPLFRGLSERGIQYEGFLYLGLILTNEGLKVLEFNVRLGDPETQVLMLAINEDIGELFFQAARGELEGDLFLTGEKAACVVLASENYGEGEVEFGREISGIELVDTRIFFGGIVRENETWKNAGGRVLSICSTGEGAVDRCLGEVRKVFWEGVQYRNDFEKI